jgi:hypothetical protein
VTGALVVAVGLGACTSGGGATAPSSPQPAGTVTTVVGTRTVAPPPTTYTPPAPATRAPYRGKNALARGEKPGRCPYIQTGLDQDQHPGPVNLADIEGDRVGHTTVLTNLDPVGCRFYFAYGGYEGVAHEAIAEIRPQRLASATAAHNAMVLVARTGRQQYAVHNLIPGVDGIGFRTKFFGPDGDKDWAFAFARGRVMVIVYTQVTVSSSNARYLAQAIAAKF